jgi:hypothetical protein
MFWPWWGTPKSNNARVELKTLLFRPSCLDCRSAYDKHVNSVLKFCSFLGPWADWEDRDIQQYSL